VTETRKFTVTLWGPDRVLDNFRFSGNLPSIRDEGRAIQGTNEEGKSIAIVGLGGSYCATIEEMKSA